jgi:uncharacterized membrane protein
MEMKDKKLITTGTTASSMACAYGLYAAAEAMPTRHMAKERKNIALVTTKLALCLLALLFFFLLPSFGPPLSLHLIS